MCEVAAASATHLPASGLPCQIEAAQQQTMPTPVREGGGLSGALGKVWEVLTLVFYGLRGILILLLDLAKNLFKAKPAPRPKTSRPVPSSGTGGAVVGGAGQRTGGHSARPGVAGRRTSRQRKRSRSADPAGGRGGWVNRPPEVRSRAPAGVRGDGHR